MPTTIIYRGQVIEMTLAKQPVKGDEIVIASMLFKVIDVKGAEVHVERK